LVTLGSELVSLIVSAAASLSLFAVLVFLIAALILHRKSKWSPFKNKKSIVVTAAFFVVLVALPVGLPLVVKVISAMQIRSLIKAVQSCTAIEVTHTNYGLGAICAYAGRSAFADVNERKQTKQQLRQFEVTDRDLIDNFAAAMTQARYVRRSPFVATAAQKYTTIKLCKDSRFLASFGIISGDIIAAGPVGLYTTSASRLWLKVAEMSKHPLGPRFRCQENLKKLGEALATFRNLTEGRYPPADSWCDSLLAEPVMEQAELNLTVEVFICPSAPDAGCHYALNPNCEPNSPDDTVLLFEASVGWNQHGGPELLETNHHAPAGANILFNNGAVRFITKTDIPALKW